MDKIIYLTSLLLTFLQIARDGLVICWKMMVKMFTWIIEKGKKHLPIILDQTVYLLAMICMISLFLLITLLEVLKVSILESYNFLFKEKLGTRLQSSWNTFLSFIKNWNVEIKETFIWPEIASTITRLKPFINYNATECKFIMKDVFVNESK